MKTAILICALLAGCAGLPKGIEMTPEERAACEAEGCSVWTLKELQRLVQMAMQKGFAAGKGSI